MIAAPIPIPAAHRAVVAEERRYWHVYPVKVRVGSCDRRAHAVACNVSVTGVFTEQSVDEEATWEPSAPVTVTYVMRVVRRHGRLVVESVG
jgi:hypothetical protein